MSVEVSGSVRVDLLGGTLDLVPINLILPNVVTLNLATSLKAKVKLIEINFDGIEIYSKDYNTEAKFTSNELNAINLKNNYFGNLNFIVMLLDLFSIRSGVRIELESGSPPGAGLGGSSAMGVTLFKALTKFQKKELNKKEAISKVNSLEAVVIDCPAGYQDYHPALYGGVLGLTPVPGDIVVHQLFTPKLKDYLERHLTLVYSGETRLSGINNWEVYKAFFNKDETVRAGLLKIASLSHQAFLNLKENRYDELCELINKEGEERRKLFPNILTPKMNELREELVGANRGLGLKICGAGGGGCFIITHPEAERDFVSSVISKYEMKKLDFFVEAPIE